MQENLQIMEAPISLAAPKQNFLVFLRKRKSVLLALNFLLLIFLLTIFSSFFTVYQPDEQGDLISERYLAPSLQHPFGTDKFARDVFSRVLYGGRISLTIGLSVVFLSVTIGILYGAISGYSRRWIDALMMRFLDFILAFPVIFLMIAIIAIFRPNFRYLILVLGLTGWMEIARLVRAEVLVLKEKEFIQAAKGFGFSHVHILFKHLIPNCLTPVLVAIPLKIGEIILLESALSFIGVGVQPPTASWGSIIYSGKDVLLNAWWISTIPGVFIVLTVLCFNLVGEAMRNYLSPNH